MDLNIGRKSKTFILAVALYLSLLSFSWNKYIPAEDALINFTYVLNLLEGHGYVYNRALDPVEGGTPLLWILSLAIGGNIIPDIPLLARLYSILAGILLIWIATSFCELVESNYKSIYISPFVIAVTFTPVHSLVGFSTVIFGTVFASMLYSGIMLLNTPRKISYQALFVTSGLILSMIRPDGAILAAPSFLLLLLLTSEKKAGIKMLISFGSLLSIFHISRFLYFGYIFPNPFYVKSSNSVISPGSLLNIIDSFASYNITLLIVVSIGVVYAFDKNDKNTKNILFTLFPLGVYSISYLFITQSQNVAYRFQYPYIIATIFLLPFGIEKLVNTIEKYTTEWKITRGKTAITILVLLMLVAQPVVSLVIFNAPGNGVNQNEIIVSNELDKYDKNNTILLTQAGAHAYYSGWNAIDAMGLNNEYIAHNGYSNEYIKQFDPDVIQVYTNSPLLPQCTSEYNRLGKKPGTRDKMINYARKNNYTLASVVSLRSGRFNWYFVNNSTEQSDNIIKNIRNSNVKTMDRSISRLQCQNKM